jgi:hypothetical protein
MGWGITSDTQDYGSAGAPFSQYIGGIGNSNLPGFGGGNTQQLLIVAAIALAALWIMKRR